MDTFTIYLDVEDPRRMKGMWGVWISAFCLFAIQYLPGLASTFSKEPKKKADVYVSAFTFAHRCISTLCGVNCVNREINPCLSEYSAEYHKFLSV